MQEEVVVMMITLQVTYYYMSELTVRFDAETLRQMNRARRMRTKERVPVATMITVNVNRFVLFTQL